MNFYEFKNRKLFKQLLINGDKSFFFEFIRLIVSTGWPILMSPSIVCQPINNMSNIVDSKMGIDLLVVDPLFWVDLKP